MVFNEQRQAQRKVVKVKAMLTTDGGAPIQARTVDLAASGMCVASPEPFGLGAIADIDFELFFEGKSNPIHVRSKVTYCILSGGEFKIGFQFVNLPLSAMTLLARFLR